MPTKQWRDAHPEKVRMYREAYRQAHPERIIEQQERWRSQKVEQIRANGRKRMASEYGIFLEARRRCNDPRRTDYKNYGGRGIEFRFISFQQFMNELGPRPAGPLGSGPWQSLTLERINNDGHYEPGNVCWATRKDQAHNSRRWK